MAIAMSELYETRYRIFNHLDKTSSLSRPLAAVGFNESEDFSKGSLLEEMMQLYIGRRIKELFGLSFVDFMELPVDVVNMMFRVVETDSAKKAAEISQIEHTLGKP